MTERICSVDGCGKQLRARGYCSTHYAAARSRQEFTPNSRIPTEVRFWANVDRSAPNGCWTWTGRLLEGYGRFVHDGHHLPHRWSYSFFVGPIPDGLTLDHLCRNRACVNPEHLDPCTSRENSTRGIKGCLTTHCPRGHAYDEANTYRRKANGHRVCRKCNRDRMRAHSAELLALRIAMIPEPRRG